VGGRATSARLSRIDPAWLLAVAYLGGGVSMWGTFYDTAWHRTLSRDSFWSLPHLFMYGGGLVVWAAVITAVVLATRDRLADVGGPIARVGPVRLPFGFALAGVGILAVVAAAPVDIWYHATFGKDVMIWSPPHMQGLVGGIVAGAGLLFAAAAQCGRGRLRARPLWMLAILLPAVHVIHLMHYGLAHYTMTAWTRTPDFYPFVAAVMFPALLVALARLAGPIAPLAASVLFLGASVIVDIVLHAMEFARYTITPVVVVPAVAMTVVYRGRSADSGRAWRAAGAGVAFVIVFVAMEAAWMTWVVEKPWPLAAVVRGLPATLAAGALGGVVGWIWGGFLRAPMVAGGVSEVFGSRRRARWAALGAIALIVVVAGAAYRPQVFGPPLTIPELALEPAMRFPVQEAVFWEAVLDEDFRRVPALDAYSEGIIDGIPLPIGPGWCAADDAQLARELPHVRFALDVNGTPVDLAPYPIVHQRLPDGRACGWVGVVARHQRASRNRFVYTVTPTANAPPDVRSIRVDATVVFKDP
jgi:hypothetical protein